MNWKELRPILRQEFGTDFTFYNDQYKSGTRRIKIRTSKFNTIFTFIKNKFPELDVKLYKENIWGAAYTRITIHYR